MLTLLGSLLGFYYFGLSAAARPDQDWQDRRHELAILDRQRSCRADPAPRGDRGCRRYRREPGALSPRRATVRGKWVDGLRSSVRPMITYAFFLLFAVVKGSGLYLSSPSGSRARRGIASDVGRRDRRAVRRRRQLLVRSPVAGEGEAGALSRCVTSPTPVSR